MRDFRKIEAFCKVYEEGSFSRAGEALFLSQPTVSAHVIALEKELETRLLDRVGRTVLPTPAGEILYRHAARAFALLDEARAEIEALAGEVTGEMLLGGNPVPIRCLLPGVLARFSREHPRVRLGLTMAPDEDLCRMVLKGELTAAFVGGETARDQDLAAHPLPEEEILVIAPARMEGLPDAPGGGLRDGPLGLEQALGLPWILPRLHSATRRAFEHALRLAGCSPRLLRSRLEVDGASTAIRYVEAGLGLGLALRPCVEDALERGVLRAFSLQGVRASRRYACLFHARRALFPAAAAFLEILREETSRRESARAVRE
ncbi:MAG: LysR family transcriptional regulator [Desulfovibrio sp.]|jgi:DNA-binding transcriptional LysR family regulator|nr:LysR family transcriptional regulator [Desulfovibrio sp.]